MDARFEDLARDHQRELRAHCYRMLGNLGEAEDVVQETLLKAWRGLPGFDGRASPRTWLYKIATRACLDSLSRRGPRLLPLERFAVASPGDPIPPSHPATEFLDPFPGGTWGDPRTGPDARITARESVALAFVAALETLPPLQRAVLVLRDVLELSAKETAELLDKSVPSIESALERARASTESRRLAATATTPDPELLHRYLAAWESKDARALTELLRVDAKLAMPPLPTWLDGRDAIVAFLSGLMASLGDVRARAIEIAGGSGIAVWTRPIGGDRFLATSVTALGARDGAIVSIDTFLMPSLFGRFDLPDSVK